jgi:hypothetical protein
MVDDIYEFKWLVRFRKSICTMFREIESLKNVILRVYV